MIEPCPASSLSRRLGLGWRRSVGPPINSTNSHRVAACLFFVPATIKTMVEPRRALSLVPGGVAGAPSGRHRPGCRIGGWPAGSETGSSSRAQPGVGRRRAGHREIDLEESEDHDRFAGTGFGGGGRAGALRSIGRTQEPSVSEYLALDLSPAADGGPVSRLAGSGTCPAAIDHDPGSPSPDPGAEPSPSCCRATASSGS